MRRFLVLIRILSSAASLPSVAFAGVVAQIDLSSQRMHVFGDGKRKDSWKVSTARPGYRTPTGTYKPYNLVRFHRSTIYNGSPMPHSIFFKGGYAIHGSYETKHLGRPASHGCVRLHPSNAARLYALVQKHGKSRTTIRITQ